MARSRAGLIVKLQRSRFSPPRVNGIDIAAEVVGAHRQTQGTEILKSEF
jgi:hypothetical protein